MTFAVSASSLENIEEEESNNSQVRLDVDIASAYNRGLVDFNFFAGLALPEVMRYAFPPFYLTCFHLLTTRSEADINKILRFALGLPRGFIKTTFVKLIIAWLLAYDRAYFIAVICANAKLADALVTDISDIMGSPNMEAVYGAWAANLTTDALGDKQCYYHGTDVLIQGRGAEGAIRGLNIKNKRPDFIFCDDAQTKENDKSETERANLLTWLVGTLFKAITPDKRPRWIVYLGNMYSEQCILNRFKLSKFWISLVTGAILEDGTPLFPELFNIEELQESFQHDEEMGKAEEWFAEVMNDPTSASTSLLRGPLPIVPDDMKGEPDGVCITIDPAGFKSTSDDNVVSVHYRYDNRYRTVARTAAKLNPEELIVQTFIYAIEHGATLIGVESVAYQQTLEFWIRHFIVEYNIQGIEIVPLEPKGRTKEYRIRQYIDELYAFNTYQDEGDVRASFTWQARMYKIGGKKNRDDILDADAYLLDLRNEYQHLILNNKRNAAFSRPARVRGNNTPF